MPIPSFTDYGLLPEGIHPCNFTEAQGMFCTNDRRRMIWQGLKTTIQEMRQYQLTGGVLLVDGSFVTDKTIPSDIEVIYDVTGVKAPVERAKAILFFNEKHQFLKDKYDVDWYPNLPGNNDFSLFFQYIGEKTAVMKNLPPKTLKGILSIESWEAGF